LAKKMAKTFVAESDLQKAILKGDHRALLGVLRPLAPAARAKLRPEVMRVVKVITAAWSAYDDKSFAGWGRKPTEAQQQAAAVASLMCGTAEDVADQGFDIDQLIAVGREFSPPALADLATALMKANAWQSHIRDVQRLLGAGLSRRPDCDEYVLGLMLLFRRARTDKTTFDELFAEDPGLEGVLLRILEVEGTQDVSLASVDKYMRSGKSWAERLIELSERGIYKRAVLIDKALSALERGWIQYRSGWFSQFHQQLAPTIAEMKPHTPRYLALVASRIPPTVTFALDCVAELDAAGCIDSRALIDALRPAFMSAVKGHIEAGLKIADRVVKRDPTLAPLAAQAVVPALAHDSAQLQKQVLKRLADWDASDATRDALGAYSTSIAAVNREAFKVISRAGRKPAPDKPRATVAAPAAVVQGPRNPLDAEFAIAPIETFDELIERTAYVFENDTDADEFERVIGALVRLAPYDDAKRARFAAVAKRVPKVRKPVAHQAARLLHFCLTGELIPSNPTQNYFGHPNLVTRYLGRRIDDLANFSKRAKGNLPLSTPTHRRGFIDAVELTRRLAAYRRHDIDGSQLDMAVALLRLGAGSADALKAARELEDEDFARALRRALGDDVKPRDRELLAAAQRMRQIFARKQPATRGWKIVTKKFKYGGARPILELERPEAHDSTDLVAVLEHEAALIEVDGWYETGAVGSADEGSICFYATMLPADLENFCAEGTALLSRNLDWFQAHWEHKAYLRALLDPTVAMGPMATLLLALGLAGKEAGETAVAADVLVQSAVEGRLDAKLLARDVARLLRADQTACARYAKSLRAALRVDAAVAPALAEVLFAATTARPEDPPKDTAALLELLIEIVVANELTLPAETRAVLESMQLGGKGKSLRQQLLARV
jgi:hypothetical protein